MFIRKNLLSLLFIVLGTGLTIALTLSGCTKSKDSAQKRTLQIYCWSNYFNPDVIKTFEETTGAKVEFSYFSSNEELLAKLQAGARGYDLIVPSGYLVRALKELKLVEPLGSLNWPELKKLVSIARAPTYDPNHQYVIPYAWGTTGLAVNKEKIKDKVASWSWVFEPTQHPELKNQVTMLDDGPTVVGTALKYLGYSYNESSPVALEKVKLLLIKQKKFLKAYTSESQPELVSGQISIAHAFSGDTLQVQKRHNPNIIYVLPKEGGEIFIDNLAIPKGARSVDLAKEFIRFTLKQKTAALQVEHLFYAPAVDVQGLLTNKALYSDSAVFPKLAELKNFEFLNDDPERIDRIQKIWTDLKSL